MARLPRPDFPAIADRFKRTSCREREKMLEILFLKRENSCLRTQHDEFPFPAVKIFVDSKRQDFKGATPQEFGLFDPA